MDRAPGEFGNLWAFAKPVDEEEWAKVQMAEIKHGRLAMLGTMGCLVQEAVTGEGPVEQLFTGNVRKIPKFSHVSCPYIFVVVP